ncbi:uncharacterized protein ACLA_051930 [Aspergillus clavatus NRRL 1]|uniref:Uncharacterized protein n=1 Tax=Aspergillus clavatus (strain ATCC 1007 / CBS 513.65 / DSM 816 / NCTC 3887 / NRRL 1 / QM 1276 / 107) TaxID=344612 RepID=A1CIL6_ASPCL|nr:uncharacterized protein ACLA_051930 [Aspergillus clavatus NRRL 1]EAW10721.1 hypothetical protein ACLA_051930 [Aspergillus clavatus NRRL 1]
MASASTSASTSASASASVSASSSASASTAISNTTAPSLQLSANFAGAHSKSPNAVGYDHETYFQLTTAGGRSTEKTPNQVYREERVRRRTTRALDRAISDPQGDPSPIDFECAEFQAKRDW